MQQSDGSSPSGGNRGMSEIRDPSPDFVEQVLDVVQKIPSGRVMTYGDVAVAIAPHPDLIEETGSYGARLVGNVMSRFGSAVPWWRVIRSTGQPPRFHEQEALPFYETERTPLIEAEDNYRIDLKLARYDPDRPDIPTQATMPGL
jgi:alkylated DNA nucleotide flippase Atl1